MSGVPKSRRTMASTEYLFNAQKLFAKTVAMALRLPKRWQFLVTERTVDHAEKVLFHAKAANSIYVSCAIDAQLRRLHLQQAYCHAQALSSMVDQIYQMHPVRTVGEGNLRPAVTDGIYVDLIRCLGSELSLLKGVMKADLYRYKDYLKGPSCIPEGGLQMSFMDLEGIDW